MSLSTHVVTCCLCHDRCWMPAWSLHQWLARRRTTGPRALGMWGLDGFPQEHSQAMSTNGAESISPKNPPLTAVRTPGLARSVIRNLRPAPWAPVRPKCNPIGIQAT